MTNKTQRAVTRIARLAYILSSRSDPIGLSLFSQNKKVYKSDGASYAYFDPSKFYFQAITFKNTVLRASTYEMDNDSTAI